MAHHGKKFVEAAKQVDRLKLYPAAEAVDLLKQVSYPKFDATIEVHFRLGVDPRHADQQVRSTVLLPAGLGKTVRILVFAEGDGARLAEQAGADHVGLDDVIAKMPGPDFPGGGQIISPAGDIREIYATLLIQLLANDMLKLRSFDIERGNSGKSSAVNLKAL